MTAKLDYKQEVEIDGKEVNVIGGSPTTTLKNDIIAEIVASSVSIIVERITTVTLMSGTTERDNVSVTTSIISVSESAKQVTIRATGTFTASASYTCDRIRVKTAGGKTYFETTITSVSITSGLTYSVSWTLTITASRGTPSGWCSDAYTFECVGEGAIVRFLRTLALALVANRAADPTMPSLTVTDFKPVNDAAEDMITNKALNKTYSGTTVTITASGVVKTGLISYTFFNSWLVEGRVSVGLFYWGMINRTVKAGDVIQLQMTITV